MKAIVWKENGRLEKEGAWPVPPMSEQEVLVQIGAAGVCTTDLHMVSGLLDFAKPPWVLGHEMAGKIAQIGSAVQGWSVGDRVVIDPVVSCGSCKYCLTGRKYLCSDGGELGTTYGSGGYGEFVAVKPCNLYRLPDKLTFEEGAMMEPLNCTLGAIDRVRNIVGAHVAVFGGGPAGLLFIQLAKVYGARKVTLLDVKASALALGLSLGADETVNVSTASLSDYFPNKDIEVVVEASGSSEAVANCMRYVAKSGTVVLYGLNGLSTPSIASDMIVSKDLSIVTCTSAPLLWERGICLVEAGRINVKDIVTRRVSFDEAGSAINRILLGQETVTKMMIVKETEVGM